MTPSSISIGCDHAGYSYKEEIIAWARDKGLTVNDFGTHSKESVDYPDFVHPVAREVISTNEGMGILICGSANGVAMTANKYSGIRAAVCWLPELATLARSHNNANVLCIPARFVTVDEAKLMAEAFFSTKFEGGRHARRVEKIAPEGT